ncbi:hypothetical protein [Mangrovicoccus sp. HB161399]|uniref:hypothetical protein n=1 Tax=Mangrovicoccus sp. HB161399 TaxID=2720392 RepID=UPI00155311F9|nr:hypothetical protein [Mangrovicoccus sp. HB161399]
MDEADATLDETRLPGSTSFLLRCLPTGAQPGEARPRWRIRLQHVESGEVEHCETLDAVGDSLCRRGICLERADGSAGGRLRGCVHRLWRKVF